MTTTATVTSSPITATVSGASVSAAVTSSSTSASVSAAAGPAGAAGAQGQQGQQGQQGVAGVAGVAGPAGPANTLAIGTVTSGSSAAATITGSSPSQTLNLVLPRGEAGASGATGSQGIQGVAGSTGPAGPANSLSIGTVTEGEVGATITGTAPSQVLNLVLPRGNTGPSGAAGATGSQGIQGVAGSTGPAGPANTLSIGTVSSGATAAATITGASPSQTLNLVLPKGDTGSQGVAGQQGIQGIQGIQGVAGATGPQGPQASLVYASITDFPATGSSTALYLAEDTSRLYQWESPAYVEVGTSGGGIVTTSASDLTSGTLPDARLSANIATHARLAAAENQSSSAIDIFPRGEANAPGVSPASGTVWMTYFTPAVTITVSSITMISGNTTAAAGLTLARMGLYTFDESTATLVARTASDTTLFGSLVTAYQRSFATAGSFPASYTLTAGTRYGVAVVIVGSTIGNVLGRTVGVGASAITPRMSGTLTSQSDLPTTATISVSQQTQPFARLS